MQATVLFDVSTLWYYQACGFDLWGSLWNTWRATGGKEARNRRRLSRTSTTRSFHHGRGAIRSRAVAKECEKMIYDSVWYFPISINHKQPRIENKRLGNVTSNEMAFSIANARYGAGLL